MPRPSGLRVVVRPDTGALTIVGTVNGQRVRRRAKTPANSELAREEAAALEVKLLKATSDSDIMTPEQVRPTLRSLAHAVAAVLAIDPSARAFFQTVLRTSMTRIENQKQNFN
jgi:hypothetical protein